MLQTRINAGFTKHFCLFKLNNVVPSPTIYSVFHYNLNTIFSSIITIIFFYRAFCGQLAVIYLLYMDASINQSHPFYVPILFFSVSLIHHSILFSFLENFQLMHCRSPALPKKLSARRKRNPLLLLSLKSAFSYPLSIKKKPLSHFSNSSRTSVLYNTWNCD